jgi:hypothetical protein
MKKQLGQSMTEYLVVLGVTGVGLLAATSDVSTLFSNVQQSYQTQSSEMNKVQIYSNPKLQQVETEREEGDGDDGEEVPNTPPKNPDADYPPVLESVYDEFGNFIGYIKEGVLVDNKGKELATCVRDYSGQCKFVNADGDTIYDGAITDPQWVDDDGKPLPLLALSKGGAVVGFAYLYNDKYHDASTRKRLSPQPTNLSAVQTRRISSYGEDGKPFFSGYEANGLIYSEGTVLSGNTQDFSTAKKIEGELVSVEFADSSRPSNEPKKYKPCVVAKHNWSTSIPAGTNVAGFIGDPLFANPSSYIDTTSAGCNGRHTVRLEANGSWTLLK